MFDSAKWLYLAGPQKRRRQQEQFHGLRVVVLMGLGGVVVLVLVFLFVSSFYNCLFPRQEQITINVFRYQQQKEQRKHPTSTSTTTTTTATIDIGGWIYPQTFHVPTALLSSLLLDMDRFEPDYGDINYTPLNYNYPGKRSKSDKKKNNNNNFTTSSSTSTNNNNNNNNNMARRKISQNDTSMYETYRKQVILKEPHRGRIIREYYWHKEELEDSNDPCQRPSWYGIYKPSCNGIHEVRLHTMPLQQVPTLGNDEFPGAHLISHGFFRDVWLMNDNPLDGYPHYSTTTTTNTTTTVPRRIALKTLRWKTWYDTKMHKNIQTVLQDALIMERLSASPRIVDIYQHCGTAVWVEAIPQEVKHMVLTAKDDDAQDPQERQLPVVLSMEESNNNETLSANEKLQIALVMSEALADLHGFKDGIIVHDDVHIKQWLRLPNGQIKLGDFNRAEVRLYNRSRHDYCKHNNGVGFGIHRSPEEYIGDDLDEQIDVFSFGHHIYSLLTGLDVFYDQSDHDIVREDLVKGKLPHIDPRYRTRSYIEGKLVEIMEKCWAYEPENRPSMIEIVEFLRQIVRES